MVNDDDPTKAPDPDQGSILDHDPDWGMDDVEEIGGADLELEGLGKVTATIAEIDVLTGDKPSTGDQKIEAADARNSPAKQAGAMNDNVEPLLDGLAQPQPRPAGINKSTALRCSPRLSKRSSLGKGQRVKKSTTKQK